MTEIKIGHFMIGAGCVMEDANTGKILCLQRDRASFQKGEWELMYGRIDQHEDIITGLRREVLEETGLKDFQIKKLLRVWHFYRGEKTPETEIHGFTFYCQVKSPVVKLSSEHSGYQWLDPQEALDLIKIPGVKEDIKLFIKNKNTPAVVFSGVDNLISELY